MLRELFGRKVRKPKNKNKETHLVLEIGSEDKGYLAEIVISLINLGFAQQVLHDHFEGNRIKSRDGRMLFDYLINKFDASPLSETIFDSDNQTKTHRAFYPNGNIESQTHFSRALNRTYAAHDLPDGSAAKKTFYIDGTLQSEIHRNKGKATTKFTDQKFDESGRLREEKFYDDDGCKIIQKTYHQNGSLHIYEHFEKDERQYARLLGKKESYCNCVQIWSSAGQLMSYQINELDPRYNTLMNTVTKLKVTNRAELDEIAKGLNMERLPEKLGRFKRVTAQPS